MPLINKTGGRYKFIASLKLGKPSAWTGLESGWRGRGFFTARWS